MASWTISKENRILLDKLISESSLSEQKLSEVKKIVKKDVIDFKGITTLNESLKKDVPIFYFYNQLKLNYQANTYKASDEFRKKTEKLRIEQEQKSYNRLVRSVDPAQKYGRVDHMENFGTEMRTVNRQVMSVVNVLITVVGSFFFGFSGVTYAYPHLNLDLATRFIIGLVPATIVFFADLYFVIKSMDTDETSSDLPIPDNTLSFKQMEEKKND